MKVRKFLKVALMVIVAVCFGLPASADTWREELNNPELELKMYKEISLPAVYISVEHKKDATGQTTTYGSGTAFSSPKEKGKYIITAAHILSNNEDISTLSGKGLSVMSEEIQTIRVMWYTVVDWETMKDERHVGEATLVAFDTKEDLAILRLNGDDVMPYTASLAPKDVLLLPNRKTWLIGETNRQFGPLPTSGGISKLREKLCQPEHGKQFCNTYILSDNDSYPGDSGGGLLHYSGNKNKRDRFELIGVVVRKGEDLLSLVDHTGAVMSGIFALAPIEHVSLSVPIDRIHAFFEEKRLTYLIPKE